MANSETNKNTISGDDFADDLDAMLDLGAETDEHSEVDNDEDVIDRLLVDNESSTDKNEQITNKNGLDEFADEDDFDVDNILDLASSEENTDVSNEKDGAKKEQVNIEPNETEIDIDKLINAEEESSDEIIVEDSMNDEPLMADFDISSDDELEIEDTDDELEIEDTDDELEIEDTDDELEIESTNDEIVIEPEIEEEPEVVKENENIINLQEKLKSQNTIVEKIVEEVDQVTESIDTLGMQATEAIAAHEVLKGQVEKVTTKIDESGNSVSNDIDTVQKDLRKLKKTTIENANKTPVIVYAALGIAILALLVGGGLGYIGYSAKNDTESLTELVSTLEEEIEIITAKNIAEINNDIKDLKVKDVGINEHLLGLGVEINKPKENSLQVIVDDLVVQNNHAQEAIETLLASVETLEQQLIAVSKKRKVKIIRRIVKPVKVIKKVEWVVNLVSFKQSWYAKRKAEEFKKKGVSVVVKQVKVNNENWFRLSVKGFYSKEKASAYAVKAKKTLSLSSVWVAKN